MMAVVVAVVVAVLVVVAVVVVVRRRGPRGSDGVAGFRRHMDALSPEARRGVIERVREAQRDTEED